MERGCGKTQPQRVEQSKARDPCKEPTPRRGNHKPAQGNALGEQREEMIKP